MKLTAIVNPGELGGQPALRLQVLDEVGADRRRRRDKDCLFAVKASRIQVLDVRVEVDRLAASNAAPRALVVAAHAGGCRVVGAVGPINALEALRMAELARLLLRVCQLKSTKQKVKRRTMYTPTFTGLMPYISYCWKTVYRSMFSARPM